MFVIFYSKTCFKCLLFAYDIATCLSLAPPKTEKQSKSVRNKSHIVYLPLHKLLTF